MLKGRVCLVTGASRGIGLGIATALVKEGAAVYITGRHATEAGRSDGLVGGGQAACDAVNKVAAAGGRCEFRLCDHSDDNAVEDNGNLAAKSIGEPFWHKPIWLWDAQFRVGVRSHYTATVFCARQWEERKQKGLVVNISSPGGLDYLFDVSYGMGKTAVDRLTSDSALELRSLGAAVVGIWPGFVRTELVMKAGQETEAVEKPSNHIGTMGMGLFSRRNLKGCNVAESESVEFSGRAVAALLADEQVLERWSGRVALTPELAEFYGFTDVDGSVPWGFMKNFRSIMSRPPSQWRPGPSKL